MGKNKTYEKLWSVIRKVLLLSNGQASVEKRFSLNRHIEKDNMSERMLGALRQKTSFCAGRWKAESLNKKGTAVLSLLCS